ncbi:MAG: C4-type zinc ribbon domain-containing protein [Firmicutes bacterium]|jgi:hypothetical protein|nr:C4-type zinc ribbon domain-containing protein [Bacillota bacterium]
MTFKNLAALGKIDLELSQLRYNLSSSTEVLASKNLKTQISAMQRQLDLINTAVADIESNESDLEERQNKVSLRIGSLENEAKENNSLSYRDQESVLAELTSLQHQLEQLEEEELRWLEEEEELLAKRSIMLEELKILDNDANSLAQIIAGQQTDIKRHIEELETERSGILHQLSQDIADVYQNLHKRYSDSCIAVLDGGKCSGCHLKLSASEIEMCKRDVDTINYCEQCGRILLVG